jgi:N-acetylneuraminic acid mutarotase
MEFLMIKMCIARSVICLLLAVGIGACGGSGASNNSNGSSTWTWVAGDSTHDQSGVYGTKGIASGTSKPGARQFSSSWKDNSGNFWLFGGEGIDSNGNDGYLNDLWKFDGTNWTWVSGNNTRNQAGIYGTKGVAAGTNKPGGRIGTISWRDSSGNLWLFGGAGYDGNGNVVGFDDMWKFDGTNWTWMFGDNTNPSPVYGIKGVTTAANWPGTRSSGISWNDSIGNLWYFGGQGYDSAGNFGELNDLWKFDGTNWTWISGENTCGQSGVYGVIRVPDGTNQPGSRSGSMSWIDSNNNLWLFGGVGYDANRNYGHLSDLWKFDGTNWTWVSGDNTRNQTAVYGTKGLSSGANKPGARWSGMTWTDSKNNLWLFGGSVYYGTTNYNALNDLWKFDGTNWTWISGNNIRNQSGIYGTKNISAGSNNPGSRYGGTSWIGPNDTLWLFGGFEYESGVAVPSGYILNDLWKFAP